MEGTTKTVSRAEVLATEPAEFVTTTENCDPSSFADVAGVVYVWLTALGMSWPFRCHWYCSARGLVAFMVKVAGAGAVTD
jgi:hypothetical protein